MRFAPALALAAAGTVTPACSPALRSVDSAGAHIALRPVSRARAFPGGTYRVTIQAAEIADSSLAPFAGTWWLTFGPGGKLTMRLDDAQFATAAYRADGGLIVIARDDSLLCRGLGDATYLWEATDDGVVFTPSEDRCPHRRLLFLLKPMRRE